jgi:hypothetical protein
MNRNLLIGALVVLGGLIYYKQKQVDKNVSGLASVNVQVRELLLPGLDVSGVRRIHIHDRAGKLNVAVDKDQWVVRERDNYPASFERVQKTLLNLKQLKIANGVVIKEAAWSEAQLRRPADEKDNQHLGTLVELYGENDVLIKAIILGDTEVGQSSSKNQQYTGASNRQFVRVEGEETIWMISEKLFNCVSNADSWLEKSFINVEKIKSVESKQVKVEEGWKVIKKAETDVDFILEQAKPDEVLDSSKLGLNTLLSSANFSDVVLKDKVETVMKDSLPIQIETFNGFSYSVNVAKNKVDDADQYYMNFKVSGNFPKQREVNKDEKEDDKKKLDEAFANELKSLEEKLAKEKELEAYTYSVSEYVAGALLKKRAEIMADKTPPKEAAPSGAGAPNFNIPGFPPAGGK